MAFHSNAFYRHERHQTELKQINKVIQVKVLDNIEEYPRWSNSPWSPPNPKKLQGLQVAPQPPPAMCPGLQVCFYFATFVLWSIRFSKIHKRNWNWEWLLCAADHLLLTDELICLQVILFCHFFSICEKVVDLPFSWNGTLLRFIIQTKK